MGKLHKPASMRSGAAPGRRKGQTRARIGAEKKSTYYAVCLIGFSELVPRSVGDNYGAMPVAVVVSKKERDAPKNYDRGQPFNRVLVLEHCQAKTAEHAKRLKAAIDVALLGHVAAQRNKPARHVWRDVHGCFETKEERYMWWLALLVDAERIVQKTIRGFRVLGNEDRESDLERGIWGK